MESYYSPENIPINQKSNYTIMQYIVCISPWVIHSISGTMNVTWWDSFSLQVSCNRLNWVTHYQQQRVISDFTYRMVWIHAFHKNISMKSTNNSSFCINDFMQHKFCSKIIKLRNNICCKSIEKGHYSLQILFLQLG